MITHQQANWQTHRGHDSSKANYKSQKVGGGPNPENAHPLLQEKETTDQYHQWT